MDLRILRKRNSLVLATCLFALAVVFVTYPAQAAQANSYAGYAYNGSTWNAPWGVGADIYTINPNVPAGNTYFEWDTVMLSYSNGYWLQIGYHKGTDASTLTYYREDFSTYGSNHVHITDSSPSAGSTHIYQIVTAQKLDQRYWYLYIDSSRKGNVSVSPYQPVDLQAFVETTTTSIVIANSHFTYLCYYGGQNWPGWAAHNPHVDSPYILTQTSNTEFYANGGG